MNPQQMEELIAQLLRQHGAALRLYATTWSTEPDDCVQQALIKLVSNDPLPDNTVAWLYRVVRNDAISRARSENRRRKRERVAGCQMPLFDESFQQPDHQQVTEALQDLAVDLREVVVAKIWGRLTFDQIAQAVGCSSSAAHRRYQSGLEQLRGKLENESKTSTSETKIKLAKP